jgi:hypothetical protein
MQSQVGAAVFDALDDLAVAEDLRLYRDIRVEGEEIGQMLGQPRLGDICRHGEADRFHRRSGAYSPKPFVIGQHDTFRIWQQAQSVFGGQDTSTGPLKQLHADLLFQSLDLQRDSGWAFPASFRRLCQTSMSYAFDEGSQNVDIKICVHLAQKASADLSPLAGSYALKRFFKRKMFFKNGLQFENFVRARLALVYNIYRH